LVSPLAYLIGLLLALSYPLGLEPLHFARHPAWGGLPAVLPAWGAALLFCGTAAWAAWGRRRVPPAAVRLALRGLALAFFAVLIYVFHLPLWVWTLGFEDDLLLGGLLSLAPLAGLLGVVAVAEAWGRSRGGRGTFSGSLAFAFRGFLGLSLIPLTFVLAVADAVQRVPELRELSFVHPLAAWVPALGALAVLPALLPGVLRLCLGARPLPPGPLRDRLADLAAAAGVPRVRFLVAGTAGLPSANAFVAGLQPLGRTVFFTRPLVEGMPPGFLEAVLAHELAHVRRRHLGYYVLMGAGFAAAGALVEEALAAAPPVVVLASILGLMILFGFVLFGYVSRRFETEADLGAARFCGGLAGRPFAGGRRVASMLVALARLNGVPLEAGSWRHFSLRRRIGVLLEADRDPAVGLAWERRCRQLRAAGAAFFVAAAAALGLLQAGQAGENRRKWEAYGRVERGRALMAEGRFEEAVRELRTGIGAGAEEARFWLWVADCERRLGREAAADEAFSRARSGFLADPRDRLRVEAP